jgi:hypothetical protein
MLKEQATPLFSFKCDPALREALALAARADYCSKSDVVRQAVIRSLSERGLMARHMQDA